MRILRVCRLIKSSPQIISSLLWKLDSFQQAWNPILDIKVLYDDAHHQESLMSILRDDVKEEIRIIRFRDNQNIFFFNPEPPPMMVSHRGSWRTEKISDIFSLLIVEREYNLSCLIGENESDFIIRDNEFFTKFKNRLDSILDCVEKHIESQYSMVN
jgi:hypothetical protein